MCNELKSCSWQSVLDTTLCDKVCLTCGRSMVFSRYSLEPKLEGMFIRWYTMYFFFPFFRDHISGVMVSVLASSAVDCGFEPRSGQTKDYKIGGISCFSTEAGSNNE